MVIVISGKAFQTHLFFFSFLNFILFIFFLYSRFLISYLFYQMHLLSLNCILLPVQTSSIKKRKENYDFKAFRFNSTFSHYFYNACFPICKICIRESESHKWIKLVWKVKGKHMNQTLGPVQTLSVLPLATSIS